MLRCKTERITLDPIKAVSDHLSERIILESNEESMPYYNQVYKSSAQMNTPGKGTMIKCNPELYVMPNESHNMNNNLMFRSMFFMNDEPRHFLAPHISSIPNETEYFQRKPLPPSSGSQSNVASQTNVGEGSSSDNKPVIKQRPHSCEECGKSFLLKHHLATHIRVHTGERPHVCPDCGKTFALKHCLSTHLLLHSAERPYKCNECSKTFTLKHHLVSHEKIHTRERPFECRECGQTFAQKRHLSTHLKYHSGERPYSCQICAETFTREEHLVMHSRFHGGLQPYICPDCGAGFLRKFQLVEHERSHGRFPDTCPTCGKEFLQKRTLLLHVRTCGLPQAPHSQIEPSAPSKFCKECGETFSSSEGLALHMRLHIGDHSFLSDICSLAASLKQAAGTQTPHLKKTHSCPDCNRTFTQKHGLNQHSLRYPNGACKLKPFICEKCGKSFSQKNHLVLHERQHLEPEQRSELKNRGISLSQQMEQQKQQQQQAQQSQSQQQQQQAPQQQQQQQQQQQAQQQQAAQQQAQQQHIDPSQSNIFRHLDLSGVAASAAAAAAAASGTQTHHHPPTCIALLHEQQQPNPH